MRVSYSACNIAFVASVAGPVGFCHAGLNTFPFLIDVLASPPTSSFMIKYRPSLSDSPKIIPPCSLPCSLTSRAAYLGPCSSPRTLPLDGVSAHVSSSFPVCTLRRLLFGLELELPHLPGCQTCSVVISNLCLDINGCSQRGPGVVQ